MANVFFCAPAVEQRRFRRPTPPHPDPTTVEYQQHDRRGQEPEPGDQRIFPLQVHFRTSIVFRMVTVTI